MTGPMLGTVVWVDIKRSQGIISVRQDGVVQKYFLLLSRVARSPEIIKIGHHVRFYSATPAPRPGLLPIAQSVEISAEPFVDAGIAALAGGAQ